MIVNSDDINSIIGQPLAPQPENAPNIYVIAGVVCSVPDTVCVICFAIWTEEARPRSAWNLKMHLGTHRSRIDLAQMMRCKFLLAILSSICWYQWIAR